MDELKELLFEETKKWYDLFMQIERTKKDINLLALGPAYNKFQALYTLIEKAGLEDEYQAWKKVQNGKEV